MRQDVLDTHTHTLASGHAYSSLQEMAAAAADNGLELLCVTDHAPKMPGSAGILHFSNFRVIPRHMFGIRLMIGVELNILDSEGTIDLPEALLKEQDIVIASLHPPCIHMGSREENTSAVIGAIRNPHVHIIGHPDDRRYPLDQMAVVQAAKEYGKILELNNNSLDPTGFREGAWENSKLNLQYCMEYQVPVAIGSDAHISFHTGRHNLAWDLIEEVGFPEELILNTSVDKLVEAMAGKRT